MPYFADRERLYKFSRMRVVYFCVFVAAYFVTEFGRYIYRPFIYQYGFFDFGIADSIGNLTGIIAQIYFTLAIFNSDRLKGIRIIVFSIAGFIVYEFVQPLMPKGVFDIKDIGGTVIGGICAAVIFLTLQKFRNSIG